MNKPIIGITLDFEDNQKYSHMPYYALRENYINAVTKAGGTPILLPFDLSATEEYLNIIDGLIITGGHFDISPSFYGSKEVHSEITLKENRTKFEWQITEKAIVKKMPIFGICGGMQLLNVILGGDLIQHIPDEIEDFEEHEIKPYDIAGQNINITKDTILYKLANNQETGKINSSHHQAVKNLAKDLIISARANDGVIEAFEHINYPFMLGVQWHPEYNVSYLDKNIFLEFIKKSSMLKQN